MNNKSKPPTPTKVNTVLSVLAFLCVITFFWNYSDDLDIDYEVLQSHPLPRQLDLEPIVEGSGAFQYQTITDNAQFEMCPRNIIHVRLMKVEWMDYRLSDAVRGSLNIPPKKVRKEFADKFGSATIVSEYFAKTDSKSLRPDVLYEVIKPKLLATVGNDTAVLHLRSGDTACRDCWDQVGHLHWANRLSNIYVFPKAYYEHILQSLKNIPAVTSVVIATSLYHGLLRDGDISVAMLNVKQVRELFSEHGYHVSERVDCGTPDEDFIFMSSHRHFIIGGGGYSQLLGKMVKHNGGQVFYDPDYLCKLANIVEDADCNWEDKGSLQITVEK